MKKAYFIIILIILLTIILSPVILLPKKEKNGLDDTITSKADISNSSKEDKNNDNDEEISELVKNFTLYNHKSGEIETISREDYVFGVVASEMSMGYSDEALKAQAVAAYTYAYYKRSLRLSLGDLLSDYDLTTNSLLDQGYLTREEATEKWGNKAEEYAKRLDNIISLVEGYLITYEGEPILASYHSISGGKTESAKNVWGKDYAYLQPVQSVGDLLSPSYLTSVSFSTADFAKICEELDTELSEDPEGWASAPEYSSSGTVTQCTIGTKSLTGVEIRSAFSLRSANFSLEYSDGEFDFAVRGYGHGVGMSQYGANYMALQGSTFKEIMGWYYTDCEIVKP